MLEMYNEGNLNSYMIQIRMQAIASSLGELGYASELIVIEGETNQELRVEAPENKGIFSAKYDMIFNEEDNSVIGFTLNLYHVDEDSSRIGELVAAKTEELGLDSDATAKWIIDNISK